LPGDDGHASAPEDGEDSLQQPEEPPGGMPPGGGGEAPFTGPGPPGDMAGMDGAIADPTATEDMGAGGFKTNGAGPRDISGQVKENLFGEAVEGASVASVNASGKWTERAQDWLDDSDEYDTGERRKAPELKYSKWNEVSHPRNGDGQFRGRGKKKSAKRAGKQDGQSTENVDDEQNTDDGLQGGNSLPTLAVDLDGTLAEYDGWKGEDDIGAPRKGAKKWMKAVHKMGARIIVFTTRGNDDVVRGWLLEHDIPFDHINENPDQPEGSSDKVIADVYWDDRAVAADGPLAQSGPMVIERLESAEKHGRRYELVVEDGRVMKFRAVEYAKKK